MRCAGLGLPRLEARHQDAEMKLRDSYADILQPAWDDRNGWKADTRFSYRVVVRKRMTRTPSIEQAFTLARSGQCRSISEIIRRLPVHDGEVVEAHLSAPGARRELILICSDAWLAAH